MKPITFLLFICLSFQGFAQLKLRRTENPTLVNYYNSHPTWNKSQLLNKWGRTDTLKLPFFDEFISTKVYPDSMLWFNNTVFINNDFPINPPSFGVATFDDLDSKGKPYQELNPLAMGACDTLLSLPINLKDSSGSSYQLSDSIIFSFYFQRQGRGDPSDDKIDSLIVQFKDLSGNFKTVWKAKGGAVGPFQFASIAINNKNYLHKGFQIRFINFSRHTGNLNQWHIDYVHLAANRKKNDKSYNDFAIQTRPTSLLKHFFQMPYDHYMADPVGQKADSIFIFASNLNSSVLNIEARYVESHNGSVLASTNFFANAANVPANGFAKRRFVNYNFEGLTGSPVVIKREYELRESGISSKNAANDKITVYQEFNSCYAYDDGTAEYGFGYDDDVIDPFLKGAIAYRFNMTKADTLWAIGMFFNRSIKTTAGFRFDLKVWKKISPLGSGRAQDEYLYSSEELLPQFTDSINGYHVFYLDTPLVLSKGEFFIGWEQVGNNHLDVGYDINNGYHDLSEASKNLFWVDRGNWRNVDNFKGALMMRPYVGQKKILGPAKISNIQRDEISCFPNPFKDVINIKYNGQLEKALIYDFSGKLILESNNSEINVSELQPGLYSIKVTLNNGENYYRKLLKL